MTEKKRNILMIYADQWRPDQFGAAQSYTPNLDALAAQGVSFDRHFAQVLPCSPSRASLYTGLYSRTHGVMNGRVPFRKELKTVGHYLRESGYVPTLFGYTDTVLTPDHPEAHDTGNSKYSVLPGMAIGCHQPDDDPHEWLDHLAAKGHDTSSLAAVYAPDKSQPNAHKGVAGHPAHYAAEDSDTAFLVNRFMGWKQEQGQGWCAMINFLRPHRPSIAPAPYNGHVDPDALPAPIRGDSAAEDSALHPYMQTLISTGDARQKVHQDLSGTIADMAEDDWRSLRAIHLSLMAEIDDNIGRIFQQLKDNGEWENTLILFSSDHGEMMFDHHICQQASWHDQCTRLPLIVYDPLGQAADVAGSRVEMLTESIDTIPTLLSILGRDVPKELPGRSLAGFLAGQVPAAEMWRDAVYWEFDYGGAVDQLYLDQFGITRADCVMSVIRTATHKFAMFPGCPNVLMDLSKDPAEQVNVSGQDDYQAIEVDLRTRLMAHLEMISAH